MQFSVSEESGLCSMREVEPLQLRMCNVGESEEEREIWEGFLTYKPDIHSTSCMI